MNRFVTCILSFFILYLLSSDTVGAQTAVYTSYRGYHINEQIIEESRNLQPLLDMLEQQNLQTSVKSSKVPRELQRFFRDITEEKFAMADTGDAYNCCCDQEESLPYRQLFYLGYNKNVVLMGYMHGMGPRGAIMVAIFRLEKNKVADAWWGSIEYPGEQFPASRDEIIAILREEMPEGEIFGL